MSPQLILANWLNRVAQLAGKLELWLHATENDIPEMMPAIDRDLPGDTDVRGVKIARTIIDVAARAVRIAATSDRDLAFSECGDALEWARAVMDHLPQGNEIDKELDCLIDSLWDFCEASHMSNKQGIIKTNDGWAITGTVE